MTVSDICQWLERLAPLALSESWDNTGLLLGDPAAAVERLMTCLTLTPQSVAEAIEAQAQMVIAHHPLPFKAISKLTTQTQTGRLLWELARAGISVYSPHTAWDSAARGINARLAQQLDLQDCRAIVPQPVKLAPGSPNSSSPLSETGVDPTNQPQASLGAGRIGRLSEPLSLSELTIRLSQRLADCRPRGVDSGQPIRHVAIACGSGGSLLNAALASGPCDLFVTGEGTFHTCLEAQAAGISLLMIGHFASERFAMIQMASEMQHAHPLLKVWASKSERDPVENFCGEPKPSQLAPPTWPTA